MSDCRFLFVGNRRFVLEQMLREGLEIVGVIIVKGTHLERDYQNGLLTGLSNVRLVGSKVELLESIRNITFDVLVSNGCPYILPIEDLPQARYINIHPSFLPDLRGVDPVIGALLLGRDAGATCHIMDKGIDTGAVISQIRIPMTDDLDVTTLYQLSFISEKQVFSQALARNFAPAFVQEKGPGLVYYSRRPEDWQITFTEPNDVLLRKIRAFNNRSLGCEFTVAGRLFKVYSASVLSNSYLLEFLQNFDECTVALSYEDSIVFRKDGQAIRFEDIVSPSGCSLAVGDFLGDNYEFL